MLNSQAIAITKHQIHPGGPGTAPGEGRGGAGELSRFIQDQKNLPVAENGIRVVIKWYLIGDKWDYHLLIGDKWWMMMIIDR